MKKEKIELGYQHPETRVLPVSFRQVLCESGLQDYHVGDSIDTGSDFDITE